LKEKYEGFLFLIFQGPFMAVAQRLRQMSRSNLLYQGCDAFQANGVDTEGLESSELIKNFFIGESRSLL
jgi:hypothetical protein